MSSKAIKKKISKEGYSEVYGDRPFKRLIEIEIEYSISMKILTGHFKLGYQINVTLKNVKYNLSIKKRTHPPSMILLMIGEKSWWPWESYYIALKS